MHDVVDNKTEHRFELSVEGHLAAAHYKRADGVITFVHTEVPAELGGKGVGSKLVKGARPGARRGTESGCGVPVRQRLDRQTR
jgi:predicted GNAT family acetyltransferase